jgi:hypothetical protein
MTTRFGESLRKIIAVIYQIWKNCTCAERVGIVVMPTRFEGSLRNEFKIIFTYI